MTTSEELELFHYGVKGMKWGVRRDDAVLARIGGRKMADETREDKQRYKDYKKRTSRKERRADRREAASSRASYLLEESLKNPAKMLSMRDPMGATVLIEGKDFVSRLGQGAAFSPMDTAMTDLTLEDFR